MHYTPEEEDARRAEIDAAKAVRSSAGATPKNAGPLGTLAVTKCSAVISLSREELLTLKVAQLALHRDFMGTAAKVLLYGVRPVSKHQALVLRSELEELKRRCDDAAKVDALSLPNKNDVPTRAERTANPFK